MPKFPSTFLPQQAVWSLVVCWIVWLAIITVCIFTVTPPVVPEVIVGTSMVPLLIFVGLSIYHQRVYRKSHFPSLGS